MTQSIKETVERLRDKAAERRKVGWELSDVMVPRELDDLAALIERLAGALEGLLYRSEAEASVAGRFAHPELLSSIEAARRALSGEPT